MIIEKMVLWTNFNFDVYEYNSSAHVKPHPPDKRTFQAILLVVNTTEIYFLKYDPLFSY